jgi:hypothetical protein
MTSERYKTFFLGSIGGEIFPSTTAPGITNTRTLSANSEMKSSKESMFFLLVR